MLVAVGNGVSVGTGVFVGSGVLVAVGNGVSVGLGIELPFEQGLNQWVDLGINFRYFFARKTMFVKYAQGFIVLPGGLGTLEEAFEIITWKQLHLHAKPVVVLDTNGYWQPLVRLAQATVDGGFAHDRIRDLFTVVSAVEDIVPALKAQPQPDRIVLESHL